MTGDMRRDSELGALMPMMYQNHRRSSITNANDTVEIRQYMDAAMGTGGDQGQGQGQEARVRRESIVHIGPLVTPSGKVVSKRLSVAMNRAMEERADRSPAKGQGQTKFKGHPNAKKFSIRVRNPGDKKKDAKNAANGPLDPEGIKDAVLQQAILQRRALVHKSLRQGTGRSVQRAKFELNVVLRTPVQPSPEPVAHHGNDKYQTSTQQAGADGDLSPFNFGGRATKALSPMEGVPERLEFSGVVAEGKKRGSQQLMPPPPPVAAGDAGDAGDAPNDDADAFDFGYDDYGGGDDDYGWIDDPQPPLNDPLPGREASNPDGVIAPKRKRIVMNPGSRLRGELRRKSLANDANVGLQEVAGGLRRSTRRAQEPLKWWLNEKKVMSRRKYKAMPTVAAVITDPNPASPWRTVEDPTGARQDKTKVKGPPKKKGPKKGVKQVLATKEATARTPPLKQKQTANDDAVDADAADVAEVVEFVDIAEDANDDEMTEDDDTLMIGSIANNDDDQSDVAVPLGAKRKSEGKATSNSRKSSKSTRKSTKSMGTIPEDGTGVASPSNADSVTDDVGDDEIIIGRASARRGSRGSRGSSAHAAQSETIGDEATLNMQAEPSTATTVDQGDDENLEDTENIEGIENANANKKQTARSSDVSGSPSKEPARRSARNRRTVSSM